MAQKWYQKVTVQAAIIGGVFIIIAAIISLIGDKQTVVIVPNDPESNQEPVIAASINAVMLRKHVDRREWECGVYIGISKIKGRQTSIVLPQINISLPSIDRRSHKNKVDKTYELHGSFPKTDSIFFNLPESQWIKSDSIFIPTIFVEADLFDHFGKIIQHLEFDSERRDETWQMQFTWQSPSYWDLQKASKLNQLPKEWKQDSLRFRGRFYDFYYTPSDSRFEIGFKDENITIKPLDEKFHLPQELKFGSNSLPYWDIIPNPVIKDRFVSLNKRGGIMVFEERQSNQTLGWRHEIYWERAYRHILYLKQPKFIP